MKLTAAQKEVIRRMREGQILYRSHVSNYWIRGEHLYTAKIIRLSTFDMLCKKGIIKRINDPLYRERYTLTDLGKSIDLNIK